MARHWQKHQKQFWKLPGRTSLEDENMSGRSLIATDEEVCNKLPDIVYCLRSDRKDTVLFIR